MEERLNGIFSCYERRVDNLIPVLQKVQEEFGYLPEEAMIGIAKTLNVPEGRVYAVATFYEQFKFTPQGRNQVTVCRGTACHVRGAKKILEAYEEILNIREGETTPDREYTLGTAACIGCCALAPCVMVNDTVEANLTPKKVAGFFDKEKSHELQ